MSDPQGDPTFRVDEGAVARAYHTCTPEERRRKVWRFLYCGIKEAVPELDWIEGRRA